MLKTEVQSTALLSEPESRPTSSINLTEVAGYRLQERIGMGGFGEVWRGVGPGGFPKAIKILFGNLSGPQAETELRSLNRMRELRHPFLLSVERVEVIDGRVIIVTELADRSLDDRFKEVVASGQKGIPREELLGYLRDAADALDFMAEQHGLQHLDVKPDNLLLQGSHAKVGDFGLTKSLTQTGHSIVNGFTPLYSPPELFDGRPERGSDQYSLAIVYQTMLTGLPPFNGRSAAQLTSQHLKSAPDLSCLHPSDRAVVARALSKTPKTRFPSCRQFVDELSRRRFANSSLPRTTETNDTAALNPLTEFVEQGISGLSKSQLLPPATPLRPPGTQGLNWFVRPTVFISIGGLGAGALMQLRDRLQNRFPGATIPSMHFVCIDVDSDITHAVERQIAENASPALTAVYTPLRTSHEYRKTPGDLLNWLSRRWLFNIPRSGKVEGMRPLGRLAFVDHQDKIRATIAKAMDKAFLSESVKASQDESSLPFSRDGLDFVIVGATSGGTCSGSLMDAAWLVRSLLAERRLPPCNVSAILMHGTGSGRQSADMNDANTLSFLKELSYLSLPGVQRPGTQNRTTNPESAMPLDEVTILHLGDDLEPVGFQNGLSTVAEYLDLRTLTPARLELDSWRSATGNNRDGESSFQIRTFGMAKVACDTWDLANAEANLLSAAMIQKWIASRSGSDTSGANTFSAALPQLIRDLALNHEGVVELVPRLLNAERTRRVDEYASDIWTRLGSLSGVSDVPGVIAELISQETAATGQKSVIATVVEDIRRDLTAGLSRSMSKVVEFFQTSVDGKGSINAGEQSLTMLVQAIDEATIIVARQKHDLQNAFSDLCAKFADQSGRTTEQFDGNRLKAFCRQYCMLLVCQTVCQNVASHVQRLRDSVTRLRDEQVPQLKFKLQSLAALIQPSKQSPVQIPAPMLSAFEDFLLRTARFKLSQLSQRDVRPADATMLSSEAANFLFQSLDKSSSGLPDPSVVTTSAFPASARPFLRNVGGGQRVLASLPEQIPAEKWKAEIQKEFGQCVSVCPMDRKDISVLCEVEGIAISAVMDILSNLKPKVVELAGRVHSRQDIPW